MTRLPMCHVCLQPAHQHVHLPGAVDLRRGPDDRLVRQPVRVPSLERATSAEAASKRGQRRVVQQRHRMQRCRERK